MAKKGQERLEQVERSSSEEPQKKMARTYTIAHVIEGKRWRERVGGARSWSFDEGPNAARFSTSSRTWNNLYLRQLNLSRGVRAQCETVISNK